MMLISRELYNGRIEVRQQVINYTIMVQIARYNYLHAAPGNLKERRARLDNMQTKLKLYADKLYDILYPYYMRDLL